MADHVYSIGIQELSIFDISPTKPKLHILSYAKVVKPDVEKRLPVPGDDKTECTAQIPCGIWPCMLITGQSMRLKVILLNS